MDHKLRSLSKLYTHLAHFVISCVWMGEVRVMPSWSVESMSGIQLTAQVQEEALFERSPLKRQGCLWLDIVETQGPALLGLDYLEAAEASVTHDGFLVFGGGHREPRTRLRSGHGGFPLLQGQRQQEKVVETLDRTRLRNTNTLPLMSDITFRPSDAVAHVDSVQSHPSCGRRQPLTGKMCFARFLWNRSVLMAAGAHCVRTSTVGKGRAATRARVPTNLAVVEQGGHGPAEASAIADRRACASASDSGRHRRGGIGHDQTSATWDCRCHCLRC